MIAAAGLNCIRVVVEGLVGQDAHGNACKISNAGLDE
eukprot:CAMPEP_0203987450 /NCGR_PEP_ID=MMETSP0360-20130528/6771_1 /ASSEMBLY_ACC=CAM_ASM_000342 /TAXON_ID=268821 /ORGANISM="Scrippsiella Hangoei, Strain SHTV-5" /LENGTH=36 /DNA_ID= /DNA_START= /DNA_END= /DNA_ORIENTATION=